MPSTPKARLTLWLMFSVTFSVLPLLARYCFTRFMVAVPSASIETILERGELMIISAVIAADALGAVIGSKTDREVLKYITGGSCGIVMVLSSLLVGYIAVTPAVNSRNVLLGSVIIFLQTIVTGGCAKLLTSEYA